MRERVAKIFEDYDAQGDHETGTLGDKLNGDWLIENIRSLGLLARTSSFSFSRPISRNVAVKINGKIIEGKPVYDASFTSPQGVSGSLGNLGDSSDIALVISHPSFADAEMNRKIKNARTRNSYRAIVLVTDERYPDEGIAAIDAESILDPFGPPMIQISNMYYSALKEAVRNKSIVEVVVHIEREEIEVDNIGTTIVGSNPSLRPLVVITPRSGWWRSTSERGGGIACFLEIMRALSLNSPERTVIFTANTGHEFGHLGMKHFLEENNSLLKSAYMWLHLGANIAASHSPKSMLQFSDSNSETLTQYVMTAEGVRADQYSDGNLKPLGEARNIHVGGGRYISILGNNGLFHHPADTWPDAVDLDNCHRWVKVFVRLANILSRG